MGEGQPHPERGRWIISVLVGVAVGIVVIAGVVFLPSYLAPECPSLPGCGPYPKISIQDATAQVGSNGPTMCQITQLTVTQLAVVCPIDIVGGSSGKVTVNATYQGVKPGTYLGGAGVAFLIYSSAAHYVNFTSIPNCAYTSGPNLSAQGCQILPNSSVEFQFDFSVSQNYTASNQRYPDSVTVSMWQTCCFA